MVRILGGLKRGKKLNGPSGFEFRPTTGRVKSFLFSFFNQEIAGSNVLDLFSGTGSFGLEAVSRGAASCVFIEHNFKAIQLLKKNSMACGFEDRIQIIQGDVFGAIKKLGLEKRTFDFILSDPPFRELLRQKIVRFIDQHHLLKSNGFLVVEHEFHDEDSMQHGLMLLRQKKFGHCVISIYGYHPF